MSLLGRIILSNNSFLSMQTFQYLIHLLSQFHFKNQTMKIFKFNSALKDLLKKINLTTLLLCLSNFIIRLIILLLLKRFIHILSIEFIHITILILQNLSINICLKLMIYSSHNFLLINLLLIQFLNLFYQHLLFLSYHLLSKTNLSLCFICCNDLVFMKKS